jgi:UDP-N-acetyl-2-amino-2-deoxyglucuronate dehydrogenase
MIRVALVGAGQVALRHADRLESFDNTDVAAVVDIDRHRGQELANRFDAVFFGDWETMLDSSLQLDAAINCLPHHLHYESSLSMAKRKLHVLLEKPMCLSLEEADDLISAFKRQEVKLAIGYVHRYRAEVLAAKQVIDSARLGHISLMIGTLYSKGGTRVPSWVWQKDLSGGGVLMYTGIHALDQLRWFAGAEPEEVYARTLTYSHNIETEDGLVATIRFGNGVLASLSETQVAYTPLTKWDTEIFGSKGMLRIKVGQELAFSNDEEQFTQSYDHYDHFERQLQDFFRAIEENRSPSVTGYDGRQSLAMVLATYRSAQNNRPVKVD